jgi:hypothetical protein
MAITGNASDLANRPATSSSSGYARSWRPLLIAVVVAIVVAVAMATVLNRAKVVPGAARGEIEDTRAGVSLIFENSLGKAERLPAAVNRTIYLPIVPVDKNLEGLGKAERMPSAVNRMIYSSVTQFDHRYDNVEKLRGNLR